MKLLLIHEKYVQSGIRMMVSEEEGERVLKEFDEIKQNQSNFSNRNGKATITIEGERGIKVSFEVANASSVHLDPDPERP